MDNLTDEQSASNGQTGVVLLENHRNMLLVKSAISEEVVKARGYRSFPDRSYRGELLGMGFAPSQCRDAQFPTLVIPVHHLDGTNHSNQHRPDNPRVEIDKDSRPDKYDGTRPNKVIKYESPFGSKPRLDCNPLCLDRLLHSDDRVWMTEGIKKGDSLVSHGEVAIGLPGGVWGWKSDGVPLADFDLIPMRGREFIIGYDGDMHKKSPVYKAMLGLKAFIETRGGIVRVIWLPDSDDGGKIGVDDYLAQGHTVTDLLANCRSAGTLDFKSLVNEKVRSSTNPDLPAIIVNGRQLRDVVDDAEMAMRMYNDPPVIFSFGSAPVRIAQNGELGSKIQVVPIESMEDELSRVGNFYRTSGDELSDVFPSRRLAESVFNLRKNPFPQLNGIVTTPQVLGDGTIFDAPGYNEASKFIYAPHEKLDIGKVPQFPTTAELEHARDVVMDLISEFPFVPDADENKPNANMANAVALMMSPYIRVSLKSPYPIALISASNYGTGKGLLGKLVVRAATGKPTESSTWHDDDVELRKSITTTLVAGSEYIFYDNVSVTMRSDVLAKAATDDYWKDRLLATNREVSLPLRVIWIATGNNLSVEGDLSRRCYRIDMDAGVPKPWDGYEFKHDDLLGHVDSHRGEITNAFLTMIRAWYANGCPDGGLGRVGSFESWFSIVSGVLKNAGIYGFYGNKNEQYNDAASVEAKAFLSAWHSILGDGAQTIGRVVEELESNSRFSSTVPTELQDALMSHLMRTGKISLSKRLGLWLKGIEKRPFGENDLYYTPFKEWNNVLGSWKWRVVEGHNGTRRGLKVSGSSGSSGSCLAVEGSGKLFEKIISESPKTPDISPISPISPRNDGFYTEKVEIFEV